jgi:hypothetical protein
VAATLLLDSQSWDLTQDAFGNIALAQPPYALAQDAASAIKTFQGEEFFDTSQGIAYLSQVFGQAVPVQFLRQALINAGLSVPGVAAAQVFFSALTNRILSGQVQTTQAGTGQTSASTFTVINPQGSG